MRRTHRLAIDDHALLHLEPRALLSAAADAPAPLWVSDAADGGVTNTIIADFDGDNLGDVVLRDKDLFILRCYDGDGGFLAPMTTRIPASPANFRSVIIQRPFAGDFDGDGDTDLLVQADLTGNLGRTYQRTWFLANDGAGHLSLAAVIKGNTPLFDVGPFWIVDQFDVDGDGAVELISGGNRAIGLSNGRLVDKGPVGNVLGSPTYVDFDSDGDMDLLKLTATPQDGDPSEASTTLTLSTNNGASGFTSSTLFTIQGHSLPSFLWQDINGDSVKDFLVLGRESNAVGGPALTVMAVPNVSGVFTPVADPIFTETADALRARGGHAPLPEPVYYAYTATIGVPAVVDVAGDARPDVIIRITSEQHWTYRPSGTQPFEFNETYTFALVATGATGSNGLSQFVAQPFEFTPPPPAETLPTPFGSIASGDIDGDGLADYVFTRGEGRAPVGLRLAYAQLSTRSLPSARFVQIFKGTSGNAVGSMTLNLGDRMRARVHTIEGDAAHPVVGVSMYIDSNGNGKLDASDALLKNGVRDTSVGGPTKVWTFNVIRRPRWGASGIHTIFFVPFDDQGLAGAPQTRVVNLA